MAPKPFASLSITLGDANGDGKTDLHAVLDIGSLHLASPLINVDILEALSTIKSAFNLVRGLKK